MLRNRHISELMGKLGNGTRPNGIRNTSGIFLLGYTLGHNGREDLSHVGDVGSSISFKGKTLEIHVFINWGMAEQTTPPKCAAVLARHKKL